MHVRVSRQDHPRAAQAQKTHKNWRLGGKKINGEEFAALRPDDFAVIRCIEGNDGGEPLAMSFVSQAHDGLEHSGLVKILGQKLTDGMAVFDSGTEDFTAFRHFCPRELIVIRSLAESDLGGFLRTPARRSPATNAPSTLTPASSARC